MNLVSANGHPTGPDPRPSSVLLDAFPELAELIDSNRDQLDAAISALSDYGRTMLAGTANTAVTCPRCGARPGEWCTSRRHGRAGSTGYTNSAVRHRARLRLVEDWPDDLRMRASAIAGVFSVSPSLAFQRAEVAR